MLWIMLLIILLAVPYLLANTQLSLPVWTALLAVIDILLMLAGMGAVIGLFLLLLIIAVYILFGQTQLRQQWISGPLLSQIKKTLPPMSETERAAIESGTVWWDAELFCGKPDWKKLLSTPAPKLSDKEQAFIDGPVNELCAMLDDWQISHELRDLPAEAWDFIKQQGFFAMIIPESFGGLGFSAYAHSRVIQKIASRSGAAAVTVMVPNSLGPAELLLAYGTDTQKDYYLPRLARGEEIPCFALTGPDAGSDAGSIPDTGIVCKREFEGEEKLGLLLNWEKRYITLGPVATVLGLAFHVYDPEHLLGEAEDLGITCALVPVNTPGVEIGRRHDPLNIAFMNGPNSGRDVFIPLDWVIGGRECIGKGWRMLVERLSIGRGISLPSLSTAAGKSCADATGAYARLRKQFRVSIGRFQGVEEALARIAGFTYIMDSGVRLTTTALDQGEKPAVVTAIAKRYLTELMRQTVNDAMDVHGGRGICMGPSNYLGRTYQSIPVAITVEGANILTRSMMVFGQGAIRCHPYLQREMQAAAMEDTAAGLKQFDSLLTEHLQFTLANSGRAFLGAISGGLLLTTPRTGACARHYRQIGRFSAALAVLADLAMLSLGGGLKRRESISGRFADIMAWLYLASAVLKRFEDDGQPEEDLPLVDWACCYSLYQVQQAFDGLIANFPIRPIAWVMRLLALPLGCRMRLPDDELAHKLATTLIEPGSSRDRLVDGIYVDGASDGVTGRIHHAMQLSIQAEPIERRLHEAGERYRSDQPFEDWLAQLVMAGKLTADESKLLREARQAVRAAVMVDDFSAQVFTQG